MSVKYMTFDIYADVRNNNHDIIKKHFGEQAGISFKDCCEKLAETNEEFSRKFNSNTLTWRGYELYGNLK